MKKILFITVLFISACGFAQTYTAGTNNANENVPASVLTNDSTYWTISTLSGINYVNTTPGAWYNTYKSGGGMIVKFKFSENNRFEFMLYVQVNTYGMETETWTHVEGNVVFTKDAKGQNIFITNADKGTYRITKNGNITSRSIPAEELKNQQSATYLWEKTTLAGDPDNVYLLTVNLKDHPGVDINDPKTIDPSWVSKFHIPL